jgi:pyrimidine operon attenuation protein/uracil phosphoribosyltransferase
MEADEIRAFIEAMASDLAKYLARVRIEKPIMVGIRTGGVWLAERLHGLLELEEPLGTLDISFYRDDFTRIGMNPEVHPSNLPVPVGDRHIILVDDVLHTGRTIRAALNEIFDYGRPASVVLAALVERSGHELPIQADVVGIRPDLEGGEHITLTGPEPLGLVIGRASNRVSREHEQQAGKT